MLTPKLPDEAPETPEFITDKLGQEIRAGDRIAYATAVSSSAYLNLGEVLGFQYSKPGYYKPILKIRVQKEGGDKSSLINVSGNHYVKVIKENVN